MANEESGSFADLKRYWIYIDIESMKRKIISLALNFLFITNCSFCFSQNAKIDSLLGLLKTDKPDTNKLIHLNKLSRGYNAIGSYDSALLFANSALQLSNDILKTAIDPVLIKTTWRALAAADNGIGNVYSNQGNYQEALKYYSSCLTIREKIDDKLGQAAAFNNIGNIFFYQGNYPEALKNNFASLKIYDAMDQKADVADSYNNIGAIYHSQKHYSEALKNYMASLKIREAIGDKRGIGDSYNNIGAIYYSQLNYAEALNNYLSSLKIRESMDDKRGIASIYNNIGEVYFNQSQQEQNPVFQMQKLDEALINYKASLKIKEAIGGKAGIAGSYLNIGVALAKQNKNIEAEDFLIKAKNLAKEIGYKECLKEVYNNLTVLDSAKGNFKEAYENHKLYILYRDSLDNEETRKRTIQSQMTYEFEKKEAVTEAEHKKELENQQILSSEKSRKQRYILILVSCFLALVLAFAGFIFRTLKITRKQKGLIEHQKLLVEEHQKEIIDSIMYARRIQQSLLPTEKYIGNSLTRLKMKSDQ